MRLIPYGRHSIHQSDMQSVVRVLKSDYITQGPHVKIFERALAKYCGATYAVAVSSGTAALHIACLAAGLKKGDEAITTPITFLATPNSILYTGATPVFADIQSLTGNIDPQDIVKKISSRTKAILPVHFAGQPCDMPAIHKIAKSCGLKLIEDASHALGASYQFHRRWFKVGSCRHADMTIFSFHPVKHITTGEGGAITTNNKMLYTKLLALRSHGIYKNRRDQKYRPWYYEMKNLGFNYRITDFQCALGMSQLSRLNALVSKRRTIAKRYHDLFTKTKKEGLGIPIDLSGFRSSYHLYVVRIPFAELRKNRAQLMLALRKRGIATQVHYIPVYKQPFYQGNKYTRGTPCPKAEKFYEEALSIPIYPDMTFGDVRFVAKNLIDCLK